MTGDQQPTGPTTTLEQRLNVDFALQAAGLGIWEYDPVANLVLLDKRCRALFGLVEENPVSYEKVFTAIHPDDAVRVDQAAQRVINPQSNGVFDETYRTIGINDGRLRWVRFQGRVDFTQSGGVQRFAGVAQEVTKQVLERQRAETNETKLRGLIAAAPVAIGLLMGRDLVIENPNQAFIDIVGKGPDIEGLPLRQVMPEMLEYGQPFVKILDDIFTTGVPFIALASPAKIVQDGVLTEKYYNIYYSPVYNEIGEIYAISSLGIEVSEEVKARQQLQEVATTLRGAIEVADMGTWTLDMVTGRTAYSERLRKLFEFTQDSIELEHLYNPILEADQVRLADAVRRAAASESTGLLDEEYTIVTQHTGRHRIVRAQGQMYFDSLGRPLRLVGTMRDVTEERQIHTALEQLVEQRTAELAATNEELASSNEEYAAINEELEESNSLLVRSNENLQTFAYVASHDLQEPLRKIQQFGNLLQLRQGEGRLDAESAGYVARMQTAASRMSTLIKDLLNYSRISTQRNSEAPVSLNKVVGTVLDTLDMTISQSNAQVQVDVLPIISGDAVQLGQLFQNLLSNALKFHHPDVPPRIHIRSELIVAEDLPARVNPARRAPTYECIQVIDNGIGFDEKYLDRIFQVFQRLHGRSEYVGTGVGLAICEKVVTNHGGAITAHSQLGQGATFSVYLPVW